jgi:glycosyltransferase involved in cell wall biosynthesis
LAFDDLKVSVIIPVYNEENSIGNLISNIMSLFPHFELIVINDGSTDNTAEMAAGAGAAVFSHPYNIGNGAAIKSGIRRATGDIFVFMDGDGQHNPKDISKLLDHIAAYDMVVGARLKMGRTSLVRALGNKAYNWFASYVAKFSIKDLTSGFRAIKSRVAKDFLYLLPNTYSYPTTLTLAVLRSGLSVKYVPIDIRKRETGSSKIKLMKDGVRFFMIITRICTLYSPMRVFLPVSFFMFLTGLLNYVYTFLKYGRFTNMSVFLFVTSILIFMMSLISEQVCQMRLERQSADRPVLQSYPSAEDSTKKSQVV